MLPTPFCEILSKLLNSSIISSSSAKWDHHTYFFFSVYLDFKLQRTPVFFFSAFGQYLVPWGTELRGGCIRQGMAPAPSRGGSSTQSSTGVGGSTTSVVFAGPNCFTIKYNRVFLLNRTNETSSSLVLLTLEVQSAPN